MARMETIGSISQRIKSRFSSHPGVWGVTRNEEDFTAHRPVTENDMVGMIWHDYEEAEQTNKQFIEQVLQYNNLQTLVEGEAKIIELNSHKKEFIRVKISDPLNHSRLDIHGTIRMYTK